MKLEKRSYAILGQLFSLIVVFLAHTQAYGDVPTFDHSYLITTRQQPCILGDLDVLPSGKMFFFSANGHYVQQDDEYMLDNETETVCMNENGLNEDDSHTMPSTTFLDKLEEDVRKTANGTRTAHLILYVHGLGVTFPTAVLEEAQFGRHLQGENINNDADDATTCIDNGSFLPKDCILCPQDARKGLYPGLLIAFDWPSFPLFGPPPIELLLLEQLLAPKTAREIRMRAEESAEALANVFEYVVEALRLRLRPDGIRLVSTLIAHSEGNFMVMKGAQAGVVRGMRSVFDNVLLLAADISSAALNRNHPGWDLTSMGKKITVYYSTSDPDLLVASYLWSSLHNTEFQARLGQAGPYAKLGNIYGIDATQATNRIIPDIGELSVEDFDNCAIPSTSTDLDTPVLAGLLAQHGSYRCVAEILDDMNMTMLQGVQEIPSANRRIKVPGVSGRFALQTDDDPPLFSCEEWTDAGLGGSE